MSAANPGVDGRELNATERYAAAKEKHYKAVQKSVGEDWFVPFPLVNPIKVIEKSKTEPMYAAFMLQFACSSIAKMEEKNVREYVAAAYSIACDMRSNEIAIRSLARDVEDRRYKNGVPIEVVSEDILHYLFLYVFFQSRIRTRDRATQYAQGLKEYFYEGRPPTIVGEIILKHGPDLLRRVAQRKAKLIEGAREYIKQGKDPTAPPFDEVLAALMKEETTGATTGAEDEAFDHGSRAVPPGGSNDEESDADWIADAEREGANDEESDSEVVEVTSGGVAVEDEENDGNEVADDGDLPPEVDEFFRTAMRTTSKLFVEVNDNTISTDKREALTVLVLQLTRKIMLLRGLLT